MLRCRGVPDTWRLGTDEARARVAIVGCGGAGCNTLRPLAAPPNAERIALNDAPHPSMAGLSRRVLLRPDRLRDFAFMDEHVVQKMETDEEKGIAAALLDRDLVIILGGLGGQLGGWAMGLVGRVARILGDASVGLATLPFRAEGSLRRETSEAQLDLLTRKADGVVTFANDCLMLLAPDLPLARSFAILGGIMGRAASGLGGALSRTDIVPFRRLFARSRDWRYGMGAGTGPHGCFLAVEEAFKSPWFTVAHEDLRFIVAVVSQPPGGRFEDEILHEIRLRSPSADIAWAVLPEPEPSDRVAVRVFAAP